MGNQDLENVRALMNEFWAALHDTPEHAAVVQRALAAFADLGKLVGEKLPRYAPKAIRLLMA